MNEKARTDQWLTLESTRKRLQDMEDNGFSSDSLSHVSQDSLDYSLKTCPTILDTDTFLSADGDSDSLDLDISDIEKYQVKFGNDHNRNIVGPNGNVGGINTCWSSSNDNFRGMRRTHNFTVPGFVKRKQAENHSLKCRSPSTESVSFWHEPILALQNPLTSAEDEHFGETSAPALFMNPQNPQSCPLTMDSFTDCDHSRLSNVEKYKHAPCEEPEYYSADDEGDSLTCDADRTLGPVKISEPWGIPRSNTDSAVRRWSMLLCDHLQNCLPPTHSFKKNVLKKARRESDCFPLSQTVAGNSDACGCKSLLAECHGSQVNDLGSEKDGCSIHLSPTCSNSKVGCHSCLKQSQHIRQCSKEDTHGHCHPPCPPRRLPPKSPVRTFSWDSAQLLTVAALIPDFDSVDLTEQNSAGDEISSSSSAGLLQSPEPSSHVSPVDSEATPSSGVQVVDWDYTDVPATASEATLAGPECYDGHGIFGHDRDLGCQKMKISSADTRVSIPRVTSPFLSEDRKEEDTLEACADLQSPHAAHVACVSQPELVGPGSQWETCSGESAEKGLPCVVHRLCCKSENAQNIAVQDLEQDFEPKEAVEKNVSRKSFERTLACDTEAKLKASISWILTKAYGKNTPLQIKEPFYENAKGQLQVKPQLINLLTSSELYCQACSNMFSDTTSQWQSHWSIIQVLSRKGIYLSEVGDTVVTETVLMHTAPFRVTAHLALIDGLMKAYASEIASVDCVVKAVRNYTRSSVLGELPKKVDEALVFWINKTCSALAAKVATQKVQAEAIQKLETMGKTSSKDSTGLPQIADLMKDLSDGSGVASAINFYQPHTFPLADVCLKRNTGIADSLYNLRLIRAFCEECLPLKCFHFTYEDLLYSRANLTENVMVFLAELFFLLEASKDSKKTSTAEGGPVSSRVSVRRAPSPCRSQAIAINKRSCQRSVDESPPLTDKITTSPRMTETGSSVETASSSWSDTMMVDPGSSADFSECETARSGSSGYPYSREEQLIPAKIRFPKEKTSSLHSKAEEREDLTPRQKIGMPAKPSKENVTDHGVHRRTRPGACGGGESRTTHSAGPSSSKDGVRVPSEASPKSRTQDGQYSCHRMSDISVSPPLSGSYLQQHSDGIGHKSPREQSDLPRHSQRPVSGTDYPGDKTSSGCSMESSFHDAHGGSGVFAMRHSTSDMFADSDFISGHPGGHLGRLSREGSFASSRSSGEFSDHESHKIHQDHKARESLKNFQHHSVDQSRHPANALPAISAHQVSRERGSSQGHATEGQNRSEAAEAWHRTGNQNDSGYAQTYQANVQGGGDSEGGTGIRKSSFLQKSEGGAKKAATFARLPNETTWQQSAQMSQQTAVSQPSPDDGGQPPLSELSQLRLKLEEKRREIERKKQRQEVQSAKMRQRLGKAAFMRVISKKEDVGKFSHPAWTEGQASERVSPKAPSLTHSLLQDRQGQSGSEDRPTSLMVISPSSSTSTSASQSPSAAVGRTFSREGIQQTIEGVKRRWFHGSDPEGEMIYSNDTTDDAGGIPVSDLSSDMMQSCPPTVASAVFGYSSRRSSDSHSDICSMSASQDHTEWEGSFPASHQHRRESSNSPHRTPERRVSALGSGDKEDYDQSLDKLNRNLTELQGEINRLTLQQQEQFLTAQSSEEHPETVHVPLSSDRPCCPPPDSKAGHSGGSSHQHAPPPTDRVSFPTLSMSSTSSHHPPAPSQPQMFSTSMFESSQGAEALPQGSDSAGNGFFVSFGQETPRRPKPQLGAGKESVPRKNSGLGNEVLREDHPLDSSPTPRFQESAAAVEDKRSSHSGSEHSFPTRVEDSFSVSGHGSPERSQDMEEQGTRVSDMEKKKYRLMLKQQKRKEEQERKRIEKERETQLRMEQKLLKEEQQEKKKAEDKARREAIFQQYLQKKQEQEEEKTTPSTTPSVPRRDHSSHRQPRPKSMFAKPRPSPPEVDDSLTPRGLGTSSSQEDLSAHSSPAGSTAFLYHFCLDPASRGTIRKAVSCNQLTQNGGHGTSSHRRPPSPGTKLYVKPSSKSNRHIIINALSYCCLAGIVNTDQKNKVLEEIARSTAKHFLILFRDHGCQYRGLYSFDPDTEEAVKIMGVGPRQLTSETVERFYKYNSGGKSFNEVTSTKHLSVSIDALVLKNAYWKSKVTPAVRR